MIAFEVKEETRFALTKEAKEVVEKGTPEARVWAALPADSGTGKAIDELRTTLGAEVLQFGQGQAFRKRWIRKLPDGTFARDQSVVDKVQDVARDELSEVQRTGRAPGGDASKAADLKKRRLLESRKLVYFSVSKGKNFSLTIAKQETDITSDMLQSGSWKNASFKAYNFDAEGAVEQAGALHPLLKVREEFRNIFFEMGFSEMPTNRFVESSFWCFDSLFVAQQHPARDVQDTFFIKDPAKAEDIPEDYLKRVVDVHEKGGYGSIGYRYNFSEDVTRKLVLRTHTTSISSAMLYRIGNQEGGFKPAKLFSIDRVFRNEAVDATHLAEFHQVEGVVADYNITLGDLIGFMQIFFSKMGVTDLRFKPAYNPYTEPSLEIFSYHKGLKRWVEIGNSGMFRPEMLRPMGLPEGVNVLGWGLSLERPTMIRYGLNNIRDLVGHKISIEGKHWRCIRFPSFQQAHTRNLLHQVSRKLPQCASRDSTMYDMSILDFIALNDPARL
jgi:phenylalanyl-tRNA synthetase alpha chain